MPVLPRLGAMLALALAAPVMASRLALDLPRATVPETPAPAASVRISRALGGAWQWDGQPLPPGALAQRLAEQAARDPQTEVQLLVDARLPYGEVLAVIAQAQAAGLSRVGFLAQPEAPAASGGPAQAKP